MATKDIKAGSYQTTFRALLNEMADAIQDDEVNTIGEHFIEIL
jgi:hypothetical protein